MNTVLASHLQRLVRYHGWAYGQLSESLLHLDDTQYRAANGLFFGSIHGPLNHLAVVDRLWLARVCGDAPPFARLDAVAEDQLPALAAYLQQGVAAWLAHIHPLDDAALMQPLHYRNVKGEPYSKPLADVVLHLVNHGTHHRGQISAALTALGQPAPVLDYLYYLP